MTSNSLEQKLKAEKSVVDMLRNSQIGPFVYPVVPREFTNWRDEQRAWRESVALFDQSHHMAELAIKGADAFKLLGSLAINSFKNFVPGQAKHYVVCSHTGHIIGDGILFYLEEENFLLVGREPAINWVQFNAETSNNVEAVRDDRSPSRPGASPVTRNHYRYQIQGPNAREVIAKLNNGVFPDIKFFNLDEINIGGHRVRALRHGMAGVPGLEIWGPYEERDVIRDAILEAGQEFGIHQVGSRAYPTTTIESGWIPSPLPAVYSGKEMEAYLKWLPGDGYEAFGSLGGSFVSENIEDYYLTPYEIGYGPFVKFDHDFIGREALEKTEKGKQRKKVSLEWDPADIARIVQSMHNNDGHNYKYIDFPLANYSSSSYDKLLLNGKLVGFSMFAGYSYNERAMISLGVADADVEVGDLVNLVWGEGLAGTRKTSVEPHEQIEIRVRVSPIPYSRVARENYADSWRTRAAKVA